MDDEAGVHGHVDPGAVGSGDAHEVGVGVPPEAVVGLQEGHVALAGQRVRRGEAGDTAADHCDTSAAGGSRRAHAAGPKSNVAIGSDVGVSEPPRARR